MEKKVSSIKCVQCGLVNFAAAEACKRCGNALIPTEAESKPDRADATQQDAQAAQSPNLMPCPDCSHLCSHMAEMCPKCGRILRQLDKPVKSILRPVIVVVVFAALCLFAFFVYSTMQRQTAVQSAVQKTGNAADAGVSSENREAARAALNAVGEIQSVTSVGTNLMQYSAALQSAKIKFDAAMRDYKPRDAADNEIRHQLEEALYCYLDAREAWSEFIDHGDNYGFINDENSVIKSMAAQYSFSASSGEFFKGTVIQAIWAKASKTLNSVSERLR